MENQNELMKDFGMLAYLFVWFEKHKTLTNVILWLEIIALIWAVITYNFTTHI